MPYRRVRRVLLDLGFEAVRQTGSHVFYAHPDGRTTTVPRHPGEDIDPTLVRKIIKDIRVSREEFLRHI